MVGVTMVASALILGAIAGGVIVHRLQSPAASSQHEPAHSGQEPTPGQTQNRQANAGHHDSQKQGDEQDKDA
jgi:uncharacterized membrane protein